MANKNGNFITNAFRDMAASAKAQHAADTAAFRAVKAEAKANWEEAKLSPKARCAKRVQEQEIEIAAAQKRIAAAQARIDAVRREKNAGTEYENR